MICPPSIPSDSPLGVTFEATLAEFAHFGVVDILSYRQLNGDLRDAFEHRWTVFAIAEAKRRGVWNPMPAPARQVRAVSVREAWAKLTPNQRRARCETMRTVALARIARRAA